MSAAPSPAQVSVADSKHPELTETLAEDPLLRNGSFIEPNNSSTTKETLNKQNGNRQSETPVRAKRRLSETATDMSWLPPGWVVEDRIRTNGATAGLIDKYYIDPASGRRFRSKKDVQYYLETGTVKKKAKTTENSDADSSPAENSRGNKNKSSRNISFGWNFDSLNVPDRVEWVLTDANKDTWTPFIGGKKLSIYDKEQWEFAFASLTTSNRKH